jgi:hypothetical protein
MRPAKARTSDPGGSGEVFRKIDVVRDAVSHHTHGAQAE